MYQCITALAQAHHAHPVLSFFVLTLVTAPGVTKGNIVTSFGVFHHKEHCDEKRN